MKNATFEINSFYKVLDQNTGKCKVLKVSGIGTVDRYNCVFFRDVQVKRDYIGRLSERCQFVKVYFAGEAEEIATVINAANVLLTADGRG